MKNGPRWDSPERFRRLLIALSREVLSLEEKAKNLEDARNVASALAMKFCIRRMRLLLSHNGRTLQKFFATREPREIANHDYDDQKTHPD